MDTGFGIRVRHFQVLRAWMGAGILGGALLAGCGGGGDANVASADAQSSAVADAGTAQAQAVVLTDNQARLGLSLFTDTTLSEPNGTSCGACHSPNLGFGGNHGSRIGVALGSQPGALGLRNSQTNAYVADIPALAFVTQGGETELRGGHFWDGRADTLAQQALGPFLNPLEMNNPSKQAVVNKVAAARYAPLFRQVFGNGIFSDTDAAYTAIGVAIAAFERAALQPFNSKYDAMVRGQVRFTAAEARGMALFMDPSRANCAGCHVMNPTSGNPKDSPFSDFTYYATGIPRNAAIPRNADPAFFDLGVCGPERTPPSPPAGISVESLCGKFRMPTLRNVAERPAYMHNGFFNNLADVVRFYSTRNTNPQRWYGPSGVPNDLPEAYRGNIEHDKAPFNRSATAGPLLNEGEIADMVAFLRTLSDGFVAP